jgi:hypothetical protein
MNFFKFQRAAFSRIQTHHRLHIVDKKRLGQNGLDKNRAGTTRFGNQPVWGPLQLKSSGSDLESIPNRVIVLPFLLSTCLLVLLMDAVWGENGETLGAPLNLLNLIK